jgi:hypothetical protein
MTDISPVDYASGLARAQTLVPDYVQQQLQRQLGALQTQNFALQNRREQQQIDENDSQAQNETAFENAMAHVADNPGALRSVAARFPKFAPGILAAAKGMEDSQRTQVVGDLSQVHSALSAGRPDLARAILQRHADADKAAGRETAPSDAAMLGMIDSGDPKQLKAAQGFAFSTMNALDPSVAKNLTEAGAAGGRKGQVVGRAIGHYDDDGNWVTDYRDPEPVEYKSVGAGDTLVAVGGEGGGQTSSGGAAGTRGDVSRLINTDAGGGYVPEGVKTLGQFVAFGRDLNRRGAKSSSAGTYQINGTTMAEFAPKALGDGWRNAPFDAAAQEKVGEAIFNWAKQQPNPAKALRGRWVSLDAGTASRLVQGNWQQARGTIAQGETGGGAGASAAAPGPAMMRGARIVAQGAPKPGYQMLSPEETASQGLDPNVKYQRSPDGQITALGGQSKAQLKQIPTSAVTSIQENISTSKEIDRALTALTLRPDSIGPGTGTFGDTFTQFNDPKGTDVRAAVGKIGGQIIHDVSGAAVTLSEEPRFRPYVPTITDRPKVAIAKLMRLKQLTQSRLDEQQDFYGEQNGYRPYKSASATAKITTVRSIQQAQKLAPGTLYRAPDGKLRRR